MFKIAFLVLAHKNIDQVDRLINILNTEKSDVYIHCDKRWAEGFQFFSNKDYCICTEKRYECNLDDWSLIEAEIELINTAKKKYNYNYYILLSGQDYPIVPIDNIVKELSLNYPTSYIDVTPYDKYNWVSSKFDTNILFFRCGRMINSMFSNKYIRKLIKLPIYIINEISNIFTTPRKRLAKLGVELFGGSAWWILSNEVVEFILREFYYNTNVIKELKNTITPEETFFQIMAMRSPGASKIVINQPDMVLQNCKTYAYFFSENKKFCGHPYIFTNSDDDIQLINNKGRECYFARKFDININSEILDYIDRNLLEKGGK